MKSLLMDLIFISDLMFTKYVFDDMIRGIFISLIQSIPIYLWFWKLLI